MMCKASSCLPFVSSGKKRHAHTEARSYPSLLLHLMLCSARTKSWCAQRVFQPSKTIAHALPLVEENWVSTPATEVSGWYSRIIPLELYATLSQLVQEWFQPKPHVRHSQPMKHRQWGCNIAIRPCWNKDRQCLRT